jgi:hypothetical protein
MCVKYLEDLDYAARRKFGALVLVEPDDLAGKAEIERNPAQ